MLRFIWISVFIVAFGISGISQKLQKNVFNYLNLDYPGLEKVKKYNQNGDYEKAAKELLIYYKKRSSVKHPDIDLNNIKISKKEQKWADDGLKHVFFVHKGYQPSFFYGNDINWRYWPVKDNELRWQLHRQKWFVPMGKAYKISGDEKYAKEWVYQFSDWIKKNPLLNDKEKKEASKEDVENMRFAWRALEVSDRVQNQTMEFALFINSKWFTTEFLTEFLLNYYTQCNYLIQHYSKQGNHLLFEAQRLVYAGTFFPEFKDAKKWRESGIEILNNQINIQVYPDGSQFELDPHYHLVSINIFCKAYRMSQINGLNKEFPQSYFNTIEKMITFYSNICFPDYTNPCFSDAKLGEPKNEIKNYHQWKKIFPDNLFIKKLASKGKKGKYPDYLCKGFTNSGFFIFRNSWEKDAIQMDVKAGPKAFWHCQPDNGTFELWYNGKNLFPDAGAFVYGGDSAVWAQRNWFRQTRVHNTLTLNDKNIVNTNSQTKVWKPDEKTPLLVTENQSYKDLKHKRSIFFVEHKFFVILDQAIGNQQGNVCVNYHFAPGKVNYNKNNLSVTTNYDGNSNVFVKCASQSSLNMKEYETWCSTKYKKRKKRSSVSFCIDKKNNNLVNFVTIIYPYDNTNNLPETKILINKSSFSEDKSTINISVDGKIYKFNN